MNIPYVFRRCTKCGKWLVASSVNFYKDKRGKYGLRSYCKKCKAKYSKEYDKKYRETHREFHKEYVKQHYQNNKEAYRRNDKKYRAENKEAINERHRQYRQTPQGQVVEFNKASRRRAKEQAQGNGITKEQWLECMSFFNWQCAYSGKKLTKETRSIDHIEPINKGGANESWNLVPMYKPYNSSKQDRDMLEWYTEQPYFSQDRLNKIYEWQEYAYNKWGTIGAEA